MVRMIIQKLLKWKASPDRKPLLVEGIRQVGKTRLLTDFGSSNYKNTVYINLREELHLGRLFDGSLEPERILDSLRMAKAQKILPAETLIILDGAESSPRAITSLKYFYESASQYHIACACTLPVSGYHRHYAFPVGKVDMLTVMPLGFDEFLRADGDGALVEALQGIDTLESLPKVTFEHLFEKMKIYMLTGGMPGAVEMWTEARDAAALENALDDILRQIGEDLDKHPHSGQQHKLRGIWASLPRQLDTEKKKFSYRSVKEGARAREYGYALQWLILAHLVTPVYRSQAPTMPLTAGDDYAAFKLFPTDTGLLRRMLNVPSSLYAEGDRLLTAFHGALTECFVLQNLAHLSVRPRYWTLNNPPYSLPLILQHEGKIIPADISTQSNPSVRNLRKIKEMFPNDVRLTVLFSLKNLSFQDGVLNIPLFLAPWTAQLLRLVH